PTRRCRLQRVGLLSRRRSARQVVHRIVTSVYPRSRLATTVTTGRLHRPLAIRVARPRLTLCLHRTSTISHTRGFGPAVPGGSLCCWCAGCSEGRLRGCAPGSPEARRYLAFTSALHMSVRPCVVCVGVEQSSHPRGPAQLFTGRLPVASAHARECRAAGCRLS